jgi:hypothetical protein
VSRYEWLLFLHVAAAFALIGALVMFWAVTISTRRGYHPAVTVLGRPAGILVGAGSLLTLVFGVWLAIDQDAYHVWDGWILAALVLWAIAVSSGQRSGLVFARAGEGGPEASALRRQGLVLQIVTTIAAALLLADMFFKPGA